MERPELEITIKKNGKMQVHIKGVKGQRCVAMADLLKEIVGLEDDRQYTSDHYQQDGAVRIHTQVRDQRPNA